MRRRRQKNYIVNQRVSFAQYMLDVPPYISRLKWIRCLCRITDAVVALGIPSVRITIIAFTIDSLDVPRRVAQNSVPSALLIIKAEVIPLSGRAEGATVTV
jgi:hypothetical protein